MLLISIVRAQQLVSMNSRPRYKLARNSGGAVFLYDRDGQREPGQVTFFDLGAEREVLYTSDYVRANLVRVSDPATMSTAVWRYEEWSKASAFLTQIRHRQKLLRRRIPYRGSTTHVRIERR